MKKKKVVAGYTLKQEMLDEAERLVETRRAAVEADRLARGLTYQELVAERGPLLQAYRQAVQALMEAQQEPGPGGDRHGTAEFVGTGRPGGKRG
jgi:hypothetical protein